MIDELWQRYLSPLLKSHGTQSDPLASFESLAATYKAWQKILPILEILPTDRLDSHDLSQIEALLTAWQTQSPADSEGQTLDPRLAQWWLSAYARGLAQGQAQASVFNLPPTASLPPFYPALLSAIASGRLMQQCLGPGDLSALEDLNAHYADWKRWFPTRAAHPLQLHFYYYLGALALQQYQAANLAQRVSLRPFLIPCLRVLCSEHIADQVILLKLSQTHDLEAWQPLNQLIGSWHRLLHESTQLAQQRDLIFQQLNTHDLEHVLSQQLSQYLHQWGNRTQQHLACLTPLVKQGRSDTESQSGPASYLALETHPDDPAAKALPRYCFAQENQQAPAWKPVAKLGRATANASSLKHSHQQHARALQTFWLAPPEHIFDRQGSTHFFETQWFSEAQIGLFDLMQSLLSLRQLPASQRNERWLALLQAKQIIQPERSGADLKRDALIDACERLLCPARSSNQPQANHPLLLAWARSGWQHLQKGFSQAPWLDWLDDALQALKTWEAQHGTWSNAQFNAACPLPAYLYSREFPLDPQRLRVHFVHPMVYTESSQALPAALLSGCFYDLNANTQGQALALPFVASLWKLHLPALAPMARYLIDLHVQRAQREAEQTLFAQAQARRESELQARRQAEQVAEYEQVRAALADLRHLRKAQDIAWERLQQTIERPELARLGLHSQQALQDVMHNDFVEGQLVGRHRPGQLEQVRDLDQVFSYLLNHPANLDNPASSEHFIMQLQHYWQSQPQDLTQARQVFAWLKLIAHDACRPGTIQLGQFLQSLWLIQQQRAQHSHQRQQDSSLSCLAWILAQQFDLEPLIQAGMQGFLKRSDWQRQLFSQCLSAPDLDTRRISESLTLPESLAPMRWLAAFERLCTRHLLEKLSDRISLETLVWGVFDSPQPHWIIELRCQGSFSKNVRQQIQQHWSDPSGDFSRDLKTLYRLNEPQRLTALSRDADFEIQLCSDTSLLAQVLRPGIQAIEVNGNLHWLICLSQTATISHTKTASKIDWGLSYQQLQATVIRELEAVDPCY